MTVNSAAPSLPAQPKCANILEHGEARSGMHLRKDESLDELAESGNVAQFVSFVPTAHGPEQAFLRIAGVAPNERMSSGEEALAKLLAASPDRSVNVRSYTPESPRSREFVYGLTTVETIVETVGRLSAQGLYTIANETIDVKDGGVSGVAQSGVIEFAPDDTPRCVEKPGVASLPLDLGVNLLSTVYGFRPDLGRRGDRVEFSIHPRPRGWRMTHTLLWEREEDSHGTGDATLSWPNRFSRHIGDKAYGLLMAYLAGAPVPETLCIGRRVAPFAFGRPTGSAETWIRTCPKQQEPGRFTTHRGWLDPYKLMADEDGDGTGIASVLAQKAVPAVYAGASIVDAAGKLVIEGIAGDGDQFMLGNRPPEPLPQEVLRDVERLNEKLAARFGPVRTEWVHDGRSAWAVQLHRGATSSSAHVLVPGERAHWVGFEIGRGLEELRTLLHALGGDAGVQLVGQVGMTSHIADLVRKAGIPARIVPATAD